MRPSASEPHEGAFSLIELLVVIVIIGILAAITIPNYLAQRAEAHNAAAVSDLRNLIAQQTALVASGTGLTDDDDVIADTGWLPSDEQVFVCANLDTSGAQPDLTLTAWHTGGRVVYTWIQSAPRLDGTEQALPTDCSDGALGEDVTDGVYPTP